VKVGAAFLIITLFAAVPAFGENPNFTGVWKRGGTGNVTTYSIDHQDPSLKIAFRSEFTGGPLSGGSSGSESYTVDGVEKAGKAANGREIWTTANWQGPSLVILRVVKDGYRVTVTREAWSLSEDGRTLTRSRRTINMDGVAENAEAFQKQ
jgi:hypothetical protein